jgi:hypothetical protein
MHHTAEHCIARAHTGAQDSQQSNALLIILENHISSRPSCTVRTGGDGWSRSSGDAGATCSCFALAWGWGWAWAWGGSTGAEYECGRCRYGAGGRGGCGVMAPGPAVGGDAVSCTHLDEGDRELCSKHPGLFPLGPAMLTESRRSLTLAVWEASDDVLPSDDRLLIGFLDMEGTDGRPRPWGGGGERGG